MKMQEYLEAEKYVTISCIPVGIYKIRKNLKKVLSESDDITSETVKVLAKLYLDQRGRWIICFARIGKLLLIYATID